MATVWVNEKTINDSSVGNISMKVAGGYANVTRSGNKVTGNIGIRFIPSQWTYNSVAAKYDGVARAAQISSGSTHTESNGKYYANAKITWSDPWTVSSPGVGYQNTSEVTPWSFSRTVSGSGSGELEFTVNIGWSNWAAATNGSYTFKVPYGKAPEITVTYNGNGGTAGKSSETITPGSSVSLPSASRSGYTFNGWYTAASGGTYVGGSGSSYSPSEDITLYAHWTINYTVSFSANGGNSTPGSQTVPSGSKITLPAAIARNNTDTTGTVYLYYNANNGSGAPGTQSGTYVNTTPYSFGGWNTNSSGTGANYGANTQYTVTGNVTLYAKWNAGTTTRKSNPTITISSTRPTRTYYTFKGWNTNSGATSASYSPGSNITIGSNTTLYAVWQPNPPTNLKISRTGSNTTSISVSVSATGLTMTNYTLYYRVKNSGSYASKSLGTATTGTITGLAVDTDYQIYFTATNAGGTSTSGVVIYSTTLNNPSLTNPVKSNTFPFMTTITASGSVTPSRTLTYAFSKNGGSTWTAYQSSNSYHWAGLDEETTYNMGVRVKATHVGVNASDTTATKYISVTTPTNQARMRIKKDGQWKKGRTFIKVDGVWKKADKIYTKVNGVWVENKNFYDGEPSLWD